MLPTWLLAWPLVWLLALFLAWLLHRRCQRSWITCGHSPGPGPPSGLVVQDRTVGPTWPIGPPKRDMHGLVNNWHCWLWYWSAMRIPLTAFHAYCRSLAETRRACVIVGTEGVGARCPCAFSFTYAGIDYHECNSRCRILAVGKLRAAPRAMQRPVQRRSDSSNLPGCVTLGFCIH